MLPLPVWAMRPGDTVSARAARIKSRAGPCDSPSLDPARSRCNPEGVPTLARRSAAVQIGDFAARFECPYRVRVLGLRRNEDAIGWDFVESDDGYGYDLDEGLWTLAAITILTEAPDDTKSGPERSGYWADALEKPRRMGSRMWTLYGDVLTNTVVQRAKRYLSEAFQYWIDDGICSRIAVVVEIDNDNDRLDFQVEAFHGDDAAPLWVGHWGHTLDDANGLTVLEAG